MRIRILAPALVTATLISACGGGGDATPVVPATTSLTGVAAKGPLKAALVQAFKLDDAGKLGDKITEQETDASDASGGSYRLELGSYSGALQLVVSVIPGKTKSKDEATGIDQLLPDDFKLHANMVVTAAGSDVGLAQAARTYT